MVEAVGRAVTEFKVGDEVFGQPARFFGAHAEYIVLPESAPVTAKAPLVAENGTATWTSIWPPLSTWAAWHYP